MQSTYIGVKSFLTNLNFFYRCDFDNFLAEYFISKNVNFCKDKICSNFCPHTKYVNFIIKSKNYLQSKPYLYSSNLRNWTLNIYMISQFLILECKIWIDWNISVFFSQKGKSYLVTYIILIENVTSAFTQIITKMTEVTCLSLSCMFDKSNATKYLCYKYLQHF